MTTHYIVQLVRSLELATVGSLEEECFLMQASLANLYVFICTLKMNCIWVHVVPLPPSIKLTRAAQPTSATGQGWAEDPDLRTTAQCCHCNLPGNCNYKSK